MDASLDTSALTDRIPRGALREFRAAQPQRADVAFGSTRRARRAFRLTAFAAANGLDHMGFDPGRDAYDVIGTADGSLEIGNHRFVAADGARRRYGFARIALPGALEGEADVARVLTPELRALLAEPHPLDADVVADTMYLFAKRPFDMTAPATHRRAWAIRRTVVEQWPTVTASRQALNSSFAEAR